MEFHYEFAGVETVVQVEAVGDDYVVTVGGRAMRVKASAARPGELDLELEAGGRLVAWVAVDGPLRWVALGRADCDGQPFILTVPQPGRRGRAHGAPGGQALEAQMPGVVRRVLVAGGDQVSRGQVLILLEAMKMEIRVAAPYGGLVERVDVVEGQSVDKGQVLVALTGTT